MKFSDLITSKKDLENLYDQARESSTEKVCDRLTPAMQRWLAHSPYFVLSTNSSNGIDCSPKGDSATEAFKIIDDRCLAIPDRRGNNRIDSLRNLLEDSRIGLLFLMPQVNEALRIKGTARICVHPPLLESFTMTDGSQPACVLLVDINSVYVQNARAARNSGLWNSHTKQIPNNLPDAKELSKNA